MENQDPSTSFFGNLLMIIFGFVCYIGQKSIAMLNFLGIITLTDAAELVYIWIFRALSILSLVLVIAINWEKGTSVIKKWYKKYFK